MALLAFLLGVWIWDHYFGQPQGYAPGTEQVALLKIDRDLRLADAMATDPPWLRWLAGAAEPGEARERARAVLRLLAEEGVLTRSGAAALAMVEATSVGVADDERTLAKMRTRALVANGSVWLLGLAGLAFVPGTLRRLRSGLAVKPGGYGGAWPPAMGLIIFMAAILAWIGFTTVLSFLFAAAPELPATLVLLLDSAARLLPALIAIALLFHRPSHVVRVMGLNGRVHPGNVLGLFSLLMIADQVLRRTLLDPTSDPTGGINLLDAGLSGLVFVLVSACLVAPVAEEVLYRGVLFRTLGNRYGVIAAAAISATVFGMLHFYNSYGFASVAVFGFFCATFYAATRSLMAAIVLHILYNASIKLPEWLVYHAPLG